MPRVLAGAVLSLLVLFAAATAHAQPKPLVANRPAATLLLPYFEVDLDNAGGMTTLFSINNASATAVLAHVTVWSDLGVPVFAYNVYLTGYDVQTINMRDIFNGTAPRTASVGQDPSFANQISPQGPFSQDINFASCNGKLPPPAIPASYREHLRASLTGSGSAFFGGQCSGRNLGTPGIARGYVTVDTVNNCTLRLPTDPGYFGGGDVTQQNVLWGDYQMVDASNDFSVGDTLVHIRSFPGVGVGTGDSLAAEELTTPGNYTFYGRLVNWTAIDNREPLSTVFATRFVAAKEFKQENRALLQTILPPATELLVWRDSKAAATSFACGGTPAWYPLAQNEIAAFDEQENVQSLSTTTALGAATQRVAIASTALPVTPESGWLYLNLNTTASGQVNGLTSPAIAQGWVSVLHRVYQGPTGGRYDAGFRAIRIDSAREPRTTNIQ